VNEPCSFVGGRSELAGEDFSQIPGGKGQSQRKEICQQRCPIRGGGGWGGGGGGVGSKFLSNQDAHARKVQRQKESKTKKEILGNR